MPPTKRFYRDPRPRLAKKQSIILTMPMIIGAVLTVISPSDSLAQTVVFETNVVNFSMKLNPTGNPNLTGHVDNFLNYVQAGIYNGSIINRAVEDFVIQMGNFTLSPPVVSNLTSEGFTETTKFDPVIVDTDLDGNIDFDTVGLSNTRGEVSLALIADNPNSGSNSFFINLAENSFLDAEGFLPFARIVNMEPIDQIMELQIVDFTEDLSFHNFNLVYTDVPVVDDDFFLKIENVRVIPEPTGLMLMAIGVLIGFRNIHRLRLEP